MKIFTACFVLWIVVGQALGQQSLNHDFRDSNFNQKVMDYWGPTPERFLASEKEGLRLRFTADEVPQASGIKYRFHARGDFVVTAKYEVLSIERPTIGQGIGLGIYLHLNNPKREGLALVRRLLPAGEPIVVFNYMSTNEKGVISSQVYKKYPTGNNSLRGTFRLAREGSVLIASMAENDDELAELHRTKVSEADIDLIRFAGLGGGDPNAKLDMRFLEFHLQGKDLGYQGTGFTTPEPILPDKVIAKAQSDVPNVIRAEPIEMPGSGSSRSNLCLLVGFFLVLFIPLLLGSLLFYWRLRHSQTSKKVTVPTISKQDKGITPVKRDATTN